MIKTLADEFMDIMNNIHEGCTDTRIKALYNEIKELEISSHRRERLKMNKIQVGREISDYKERIDRLELFVAKIRLDLDGLNIG